LKGKQQARIDDDRRQFLKTSFAAAFGLTLVSAAERFLWAKEKNPKQPPPSPSTEEVPSNDPLAISLGYQEDAAKVDTKKFPKRATAEGKKEFCYNCQFYSDSDKTRGKCQLFGGRLVKKNGWCNGWVQNSKAPQKKN